jgi:hypothetical protein
MQQKIGISYGGRVYSRCRRKSTEEDTSQISVEEGRKRVLLIAASILAARKLA